MRNYMANGSFYSPSQIARYFLTRPSSLKPPRTHLRNPIEILRQLDRHQWLMFSVGILGWTWDAFDFFTVSLCITEIAKEFGVKNSDVSWGLPLTLMLRSVGAVIFGSMSDRYGRKWPMIINLCLFIVLEMASGFCNTLGQFLAVRSFYGIAMGGLYGPAAATALEDLPYDARGLLSGLYQQGHAVGYLLAAIFYRAVILSFSSLALELTLLPARPYHLSRLAIPLLVRCVPPVFIILFRYSLPETNAYQVMAAEREACFIAGTSNVKNAGLRSWLGAVWADTKRNWVLFIFMIVLMTGFNSCSHGSQDLFPTFLKYQVELGPTDVTVISVVGQIGALIGGTLLGYISTFTGRRLIMIIAIICGGALVPAYTLPRNMSLVASAFFYQFFVGGFWGPIPIYLQELAPPALRTTAVGLTYQLGNLASSASATIQAKIGEQFPISPGPKGVKRFNYGKVIAIFCGAVWAYQLLFVFLGPEMTERERMEYAESADELEMMRKQGVSLREIGEQRARAGEKGEEVEEEKRVDVDVEHLEKTASA